jgi:hypothetical protein
MRGSTCTLKVVEVTVNGKDFRIFEVDGVEVTCPGILGVL